MQDVLEIAGEIVAREGGFVNDPDDPGGATNYGVTIHTMRRLGLDLDGDGVVNVDDVKLITRAQAVTIFTDHYYKAPRIGELPVEWQASVFDMYVHAGRNAIVILQKLLNDFNRARTYFKHQLATDGVIGRRTIKAAHSIYNEAGTLLPDAYGIARRNYYFGLADRRRASRKYCVTRGGGKGGWIKRAEEFMSPKYHLTDDAFHKRISQW